MSDPTDSVRSDTYNRDGRRCVICLSIDVTFQHRRAVGMGGSKIRPGVADGLTLCGIHNGRCETDMQMYALLMGWKVRRWADPVKVPCFYPHEYAWFRFVGIERIEIPAAVALDMMHDVYGDEYFEWRAA